MSYRGNPATWLYGTCTIWVRGGKGCYKNNILGLVCLNKELWEKLMSMKLSFYKSTFNDIMRFTYGTMDEIMENTADTTQPTETGFEHTSILELFYEGRQRKHSIL